MCLNLMYVFSMLILNLFNDFKEYKIFIVYKNAYNSQIKCWYGVNTKTTKQFTYISDQTRNKNKTKLLESLAK